METPEQQQYDSSQERDETYTGDIARACLGCGSPYTVGYYCDDCSKEMVTNRGFAQKQKLICP